MFLLGAGHSCDSEACVASTTSPRAGGEARLSATSCRAARDVSRSLVGSPVASRVLPGRDKGGQGTRASACRCTALRACCGRQSTRGDGARRRELSAGNGTGAPFAFLYPPTITSKICGMRLAARERLDHGLARLAEEAMTTRGKLPDAEATPSEPKRASRWVGARRQRTVAGVRMHSRNRAYRTTASPRRRHRARLGSQRTSPRYRDDVL